MPAILKAAAQAGARSAGYVLVRLPMAVAALFQDWLEHHYPDRKDKILGRIRAARTAGSMTARFGVRMSGEGHQAAMIARLFQTASHRAGLNRHPWPVSTAAFRRPGPQQLNLFD